MISTGVAEAVLGFFAFSGAAVVFLFRSVKWFLISHHLASLDDLGNRAPRWGLLVSAALAVMIAAAFVAVLVVPLDLEVWLIIVLPVLIIAETWNTRHWGRRIPIE